MAKISKPNRESQAFLGEGVEFQSAMQQAGFAAATQKNLSAGLRLALRVPLRDKSVAHHETHRLFS